MKHFYYDNGTQPVGYEDSDHPGVGWRYLYDGVCRRVGKEQINTVAGEVMSRVMFLHEGDVLFGEYYAVNTMDPHVVGSVMLWPADPGTGEILGQITINTTGSMTGHGGGAGYYPGGNGGGTGADNSADDPYSQRNNPNNGGYSGGSYNHNDSTTDGAGGVLGWPQERVDAVFYSMVCDLAGAPKELINPTTGEIVGYATYTLFGKRHWAGTVNTSLLFTGQYEDAESGWVYNRFRYYDPHAGVYNAQDPLGLLASTGTTQGYVTNPVTWVDVFGLKKCKKTPKRNVPYNNGLPLQPTTKKPFLAGPYEDLSAVGPNATTDSYTAYERHHIISNKALERLGFSEKQRNRALAIQMTVDDHRRTASWGSRKLSKLYRNFEVQAFPYRKHVEGLEIAPELSSIEEMIVKAELGRIVQTSGMKYYDVCIDALKLYKQHGIILP